MKKLFTFFAAALLATSMFAQSTEKNPAPGDVTQDQDLVGASYTIPAAQVAGGGGTMVGDMWDKGVKVRLNQKYGDTKNALPFIVNEGKQINSIKIVGVSNKAGNPAVFTSAIVDGVTVSFSGSLPYKDDGASGTIELNNIAAMESILLISTGAANQALLCYEITYDDATPSVDPVLNVNPDSVALHASLKVPAPAAEIVFTGKNLTPGTYSVSVPNLVGLSVLPSSVTVGDNGKLNDTLQLAFAPEADVEAGETAISLTIGELTKEVKIAYSASFVMDYEYATSVNIEQWVLDNGKNNQAFQAVLDAAHVEYENINELDSLNDAKDARNEPYLGLKLKKAGAYVALWLKQGSTVRVKFGKVSEKVIGSINGETEDFTPEFLADPLEFTAPVDCYMMLTTASDKTVVIKQIMINEAIAEVELPAGESAVENIEATVKATKRVLNGQVIIEKNGKFYDLLGTEVK